MGFVTRHPPETRRAVEALLRDSDLPMTAIAAQSGVPYTTVRKWNGLVRLRVQARRKCRSRQVADLAALDAALRDHIARQIAVFDARLRTGRKPEDSTKVLRDLGGLKRLLDDLFKRDNGRDQADGHAPRNLEAIREAIARRYEAFSGERLDEELP